MSPSPSPSLPLPSLPARLPACLPPAHPRYHPATHPPTPCRYMRSLSTFTFERWEFHRSTSRYQRHMTGIFQSRIVRGLAQPLLSAGATATAVCLYEALLQVGACLRGRPAWMVAVGGRHHAMDRPRCLHMPAFTSSLQHRWLPPTHFLCTAACTARLPARLPACLQEGTLPDYLPSLLMPSLPFDITSFALSLLLVFRWVAGWRGDGWVGSCLCAPGGAGSWVRGLRPAAVAGFVQPPARGRAGALSMCSSGMHSRRTNLSFPNHIACQPTPQPPPFFSRVSPRLPSPCWLQD